MLISLRLMWYRVKSIFTFEHSNHKPVVTMLDLSKLTPAKGVHSITEAIFTFFLPNPIVNVSEFEKLLIQGQPFHEKFQRFSLLAGVNVDIGEFNPLITSEILPKVSRQEQKGFEMHAYSDGKPIFTIRYTPGQALGFPSILSFHSLAYDRWQRYFESFYEYVKILSDFQPGIFVTGYGLGYVDQFNWADSQLPKFSDFFQIEGGYIPSRLAESTAQFNFSGNFARKVGEYTIAENYILGANQISLNIYNIFISHQSATNLSQAMKMSDLLNDPAELRKRADVLHKLNKDFLSETLAAVICTKIGIKKQ